MLYLSIGEDSNSCSAQDTSSALGCVWRIDVSTLPGVGGGPPPKSTLIPAGNPFAGPTDNASLVWCYGLRNPFRFHIDPVTGYLYIADVGHVTWEEVNEITMGGENLGWPWLEGNQPFLSCDGTPPALAPPITTWSHAEGAASIMSIGRYRNPIGGVHNFGPTYEGDYFYSDYFSGGLRRLQWNGTAWVTPPAVPGQPTASDWGTGFETVSDAMIGSDGAIYFVRQFAPGFSGPGSLRRIRFTLPTISIISGNNQPGNAGQPLAQPFVVRVMTPWGDPIVGATVDFVPVSGDGSTNPQSVPTDSQGYAQTLYTLSPTFSAAPVISATCPDAPSVDFNVTWRGLTVSYVPFFNVIGATIRHSETNSPFTLCWETPPATVPYQSTAFGDVWTSILIPQPGLNALDGLGLLGRPNPACQTATDSPDCTFLFMNVPPFGGMTFQFQAYAIDTALFPAPESIMISNSPILTLN
jgi:hypothetical protein